MKISRRSGSFLCKSGLFLAICITLISWGKYGHEHINRAAVMSLPVPMQGFFYNHIDFMTVESNLPDVRKYTLGDSAEFSRHHIHLESFGNIDSIPKSPKEAFAKYNAHFFAEHGMLPWYIQVMMDKLTIAFKGKHKSDILLLAADLGHYIGDAYMPLHTSVNHNGKQTNQVGIHALFESRLPELFGNTYHYNTGKVQYVADIQKETWRIVMSSNSTADTLLKADRDLTASFPAGKKWDRDAAGKVKLNMYKDSTGSIAYSKAFQTKLKGMVERQLRGAIATTASFWYTAWVNAGKPDLNELDPEELTQRNAPALAQEKDLFKQGKLFGIKSEKEF
ncbi:zinc dependent phospholipase C family protein [Mucilaginibacter paludis]|uniref:S1/P1 Nuclease n=1 Tax=Mucilaginibacter paludis DSM 18603 TaxID=714943 RepID=H1Y9K8_9SPHI|nr:zinc dependent phospholipase C family protein [Mucilaginibacter paludis]EHQ30510.1 hypothetical protein Mucpa_6457 [Mucilaginibacter paludis DSM 18603]